MINLPKKSKNTLMLLKEDFAVSMGEELYSDYFQQLHDWAVMIKNGKAADSQSLKIWLRKRNSYQPGVDGPLESFLLKKI
jgi:hypothetical protein